MAPDSSLLRHQLGGSRAGFLRRLPRAAVLSFLSLLIFTLHAQASPEKTGFAGEFTSLALSRETAKEIPVFPASLPILPDTLKGTPSVLWRNRIEIPIEEPLIQKYIRFYQGRGRRTFSDAMERGKTCIPKMVEILESYGVPGEMVSVVFVESRFRRGASHKGAVGYWQLLASTARNMGLRVDRWVDERRDPIKSTKAAAKYLRTLYERYDSWLLALSAYNAGWRPATYAAKIHRVRDGEPYGKKLPGPSRMYVSKVMAAIQIMRDPEKHGFESPKYCKPKDFDPIMIKTPLRLQVIAKWVDVPVSQLQELNPSLCQDAMPPDSGFALRLPSGSREKFNLAYDALTRR